MAAVKPSLILNFIVDNRFASDETRDEIKRTYSYIAPTRVHFFEPDGEDAPHGEMAKEDAAAAPSVESSDAEAASEAETTENAVEQAQEDAPQRNVIVLNVICHTPYWQQGDQSAQTYWDDAMLPWLERMAKKLGNTVIAHDGVRMKEGREPIVFTEMKIKFDENAVVDIPLAGGLISVDDVLNSANSARAE